MINETSTIKSRQANCQVTDHPFKDSWWEFIFCKIKFGTHPPFGLNKVEPLF